MFLLPHTLSRDNGNWAISPPRRVVMVSRQFKVPQRFLPVTSTGDAEPSLATGGHIAPSDGALARDGEDDKAIHLENLFGRFSRLVLVTAYRVIGDANEAEDIVQEVFLYIHRKPHLFDPAKGSLRSWIVQLTLCRSLDRKLYLSRRGFYADASVESLQLAERTNVEKQIETKLCCERIERAFHDLSYMQRRTLEFFYFEGMDLKAISERLREPLGSVRHHLYRGLSRLRKNSLLRPLREK